MDLSECFRKKQIKEVSIDHELILSVKKISEGKEVAVKTASIDEITIAAYVSLAYDSLREMLEAVALSLGYKVLNHICLGELLKREIKDFDFDTFDRVRYIRNGINYYGTEIELKQGKEIIRKIFGLKKSMIQHVKTQI